MERAGLTTMTETINAAIELELIHSSQAPLTSALKVNELSFEITTQDSPEVAALKQTVINLKRGIRNMGGSQPAAGTNFNKNSKLVCFYCHKKGHIVPECRGKIADEGRGIRQKARPKPAADSTSNDQVNEVSQGGQLKALTWENTKETAPLNY